MINPTMKFGMWLLAAFLLICTVSWSQEAVKVQFERGGSVSAKGFVLNHEAKLVIEGNSGMFNKLGSDLLFYGWILDSKSRKVVWNQLTEDNEKFYSYNEPGRFSFRHEVTLPEGQYEAYYTAGRNYERYEGKNQEIRVKDLDELLELIFRDPRYDDRDRYNDSYSTRFYMSISAPEGALKEVPFDSKVNEFSKNALVSIVRAGNEQRLKQSFDVLDEVELNIMGVGEQMGKEYYDHAWIVNTYTNEKVWPNESTVFKKAGGGSKNRSVFQSIKLPKGCYTLYYVSDDSHAYDSWNVMPPFDPQFWGITVWPNAVDRRNVRLVDPVDPFVLKLNKARDNAYLSQGFTLKRDMKIRVYCLGERAGSGQMADYGWIKNAETNKTVWELTEYNSEHAGGGKKNRMANQEIELPRGNYIAYYVTDGSHSFRDWNTTPPNDPEAWGISIIVDPGQREAFELADHSQVLGKNILAQITHVRDNERLKKTFALPKDSRIRIYAIGEGDDGSMYDLGWIKSNTTGRVVWEMTYRATEHAGGAAKNRLFDDIVLLPAGDYTVYYETDGSHSFHDWNSAPPRDQDNYGITLYLVDK